MLLLILIMRQASKGHQSPLDITKLVRDRRGRAGVRLLMIRCMVRGGGRIVLLLGNNLDFVLDGA